MNYLRTYLAQPYSVGLYQLFLGAEFGYLMSFDSKTMICDQDGECQTTEASISGSDWQKDFNGNYGDAGVFANLRIPMGAVLSLDFQYYHGFVDILELANAQTKA